MPKYKLMKHQKAGVKFLRKMDGVGALLWEPGVGKTGATLAYIDWLAKKQGEVRVLVVAPLTAADTWVLQPPMFMDSAVKARMMQGRTADILKRMAVSRNWNNVPDAKIGTDHNGTMERALAGNRVTIVSMSAGAVSHWSRVRARKAQMISAVRKYAPHVIILDESHIAKSATSHVSRTLYAMGQLSPHRIILTGTVNPHSPLDVYGQWRFLAPWTFSDQYGEKYTKKPHKMTAAQIREVSPWSWKRFKNRFSLSGGYEGREIVDFINLEDLNNRVAERSMVVLKKDALDLPPVNDIDIHVALSPKEQKAYDEMKKDLAAELADGSLLEAPNALAKIMKLRQITSGFVRDTETEIVHSIGDSKRKALMEIVGTQLAGENRLVIFAYFKPECALLVEALKKAEPNSTVEVITGKTKAKERLDIRKRFGDVDGNPNRMILVAQARTMSLSVNELVTAQHAIYGSMSERRDDWVQSRDRLNRNGQKGSHVTFWNLIVPDSIDQIMLDRHKDRGNMEKALLDHIRGVQ